MKREPILFAVLSAATFIISGCANVEKLIPPVSAKHLEYNRSGLTSGANIVVENLQTTETEVTADSIDVTLTYPLVGTVHVKASEYKRQKKP